ncbi:MAG TPA: DNA gyrase inhibitor YacG [Polyangia bacterium]
MPKAPPCPICKRPVPAAAEAPRPFCSQRCRTIDLGSWLTEAYRFSREIQEDDLDEVPIAMPEDAAADAPKKSKARRH